jgi:general secretion pathway protein L
MQGDTLRLRSALDRVAGFLSWWRDELWSLLPEYGRQLLTGVRPGPVLAQVEGGYVALSGQASRGREQPSILPRAQAILELASLARKENATSVGLRLPIGGCYVRRVQIPQAARGEASRILNLELERVAPFKRMDVYTAHAVEEGATNGMVWVRQLVAKRAVVDPLIADVKAAGVNISFVDCWNNNPFMGMSVDFLEPEQVRRGLLTLPTMLAILALVLTAAAVFLTVFRHESALAEVQAQSARMRERATLVRQRFDSSSTAIGYLSRLQQMRMERIPSLVILEEVSRLLPDSDWLSEFRLEGDKLDISGLARSGAALPQLFAQSAIFTDAALTAPLTFDPQENKERFSLRARVKLPSGQQRLSEKRAME